MRGNKFITSINIVIIVFGITLPTFLQAEVRYHLIDIGEGTPHSINNNGQIVGRAFASSGSYHAVLFDQAGQGQHIDLDVQQTSSSEAYAINDAEQIVGYGGTPNDGATLFDITGQGNNVDLGGVRYYPTGQAYGINQDGEVVGRCSDMMGYKVACLFKLPGDGNNVRLSPSDSLSFRGACSINNTVQIVGAEGGYATLFNSSGAGNNLNLGTLLGWSYSSRANSINDEGQIVGYSGNPNINSLRATLFDPSGNGNNIDLGTLGGSYSCAYQINNQGQIVGYADKPGDWGGRHATLFDISGSKNNINLNDIIDPTLNWVLDEACAINDKGWIVGTGYIGGIDDRAFLLIPLPTLQQFAEYWLESECGPNSECWCGGAGLNLNGNVNFNDFAIFAQYWLEGVSP